MLFKISFLHERATLRMYTWNFKKLTTRRVALWKRKNFIRPSSTVILKKLFEGERILILISIETLEFLNGLNHKISFFFWDLSGTIFSTSITFLRYLVLPWQHLFQLCIFFHYRENVFSNIITLFDAMLNHNSSGFRSRSIRDIPLFSQR